MPGINTEEAFGLVVVTGPIIVDPGIDSDDDHDEDFGDTVVTGPITVDPGLASEEVFGDTHFARVITPVGIASEEAFGLPRLPDIVVRGISSLEVFGLVVVTGPITCTGISSQEDFGAVVVTGPITCTGISSQEAFGVVVVWRVGTDIFPTGIPSEEMVPTGIDIPMPIGLLPDRAYATNLIPNFSSADNTFMDNCILAASAVIERYCNRTFALTSYDELYDGTGDVNLILDNFPVMQITQVMFNSQYVVMIRNTDQGVSRASFRIEGTGTPAVPNRLYLVSMKNGIQTTRTVTLSSTPTLGDLATAINAFSADGWTAKALGIQATWPTMDLWPVQGAKDCRWSGAAYIKLHTWNLPEFEYRGATGEIVSPRGFQFGYANFRVKYTAGFSTIPTPIQQACAALAVSVFNTRGYNLSLSNENLGGWSYSNIADKMFGNLDLVSKYGLSMYRNLRQSRYKVVV